jgi:hypothetical protein
VQQNVANCVQASDEFLRSIFENAQSERIVLLLFRLLKLVPRN